MACKKNLELTNRQVAKLLREMAVAYELMGKNRFRIAAYEKAAESIERLGIEVKDLWTKGKLGEIAGVGENIAQHLDELFRLKEVKHFNEVKKGLPAGMFEIVGINGIGPKTAYKIASTFPIRTIRDVRKLAEGGRLREVEGLGQETEKKILRGILEVNQRDNRLLLNEAWKIARQLIAKLRKENSVLKIAVLGSLRRRVATVGDIDLAVASKTSVRVIEAFTNLRSTKRVLEKGQSQAAVQLKNNQRVDLMVVDPKQWGSLLQHFTGSKQHNIHLRKLARQKGLSLSKRGIKNWDGQGGQFSKDTLWEFEKEEDFYHALGMQWVPPEIREDTGEIEAAQSNRLPRLVELSDIRGDLHLHSSFEIEPSHDLGRNSIAEMLKKACFLSYKYIGFAEHSPAVSTHSAMQITQLIQARNNQIDKLSSTVTGSRIIKLLEIDILADKRLALDDEQLKLLDLAIVGVHSSHRGFAKTEMTKRIMAGLSNPYVHILSHPTGRILNERKSYEVDWDVIFKYCSDKHKALEINAFPQRLDLPDFLIREAKNYGVKFVINTDAHDLSSMNDMEYGVYNARRGWATPKDILNTWKFEEMMRWFKEK